MPPVFSLGDKTIRHQTSLRYIDVVARVGSIRKASEELAITSTALNRRILAIEAELGVPIFDRLPSGVRLSVAGELFIQHIRKQLADMERVQSQIADLSGQRRGHVSIVCGQALMNWFIPEMILDYRNKYPAVTFNVRVCNRDEVELALADFSADIALIFEPKRLDSFHTIIEVPQQAKVMFAERHPLSKLTIARLSDCAQYPMALPTRASGMRHLLEQAASKSSLALPLVIESDSQAMLTRSLLEGDTVSFQIPIGLHENPDGNIIGSCPIDIRDIPEGRLCLGYLKGRNLPVASARFLDQVANCLHDRFGHR